MEKIRVEGENTYIVDYLGNKTLVEGIDGIDNYIIERSKSQSISKGRIYYEELKNDIDIITRKGNIDKNYLLVPMYEILKDNRYIVGLNNLDGEMFYVIKKYQYDDFLLELFQYKHKK